MACSLFRRLIVRFPQRNRGCFRPGNQEINFHRPALWQSDQFTLRAAAAEPPCGDFCFVWDGTESTLADILARAGAVEIVTGPVARIGGRSGGTAEGMSRYTRDPDGNLLEFIVY